MQFLCLFRSFVFNKVCIHYCHLSFFFCFVFFPLKGAVHTVGTHSDVVEEVTQNSKHTVDLGFPIRILHDLPVDRKGSAGTVDHWFPKTGS